MYDSGHAPNCGALRVAQDMWRTSAAKLRAEGLVQVQAQAQAQAQIENDSLASN
jgi:hypothetical protein